MNVGDRVRFDGKRTSWLVRGITEDERYVLLTASMFGNVWYTIVDEAEGVRGPMNVIGGGLGIETTAGPDPAIDKALLMLRPDEPWPKNVYTREADPERGWEISRRNQVPLKMEIRV